MNQTITKSIQPTPTDHQHTGSLAPWPTASSGTLVGCVLLLIILMTGCGISGEEKPRSIAVNGPSVTLNWDPPASDFATDSIAHYNVYARTRGAAEWQLVGSASASKEPSLTIGQSLLPYGSYEFAVTTVGIDGSESDLHSSLDHHADPASGWIVDWYGPPAWYLKWKHE